MKIKLLVILVLVTLAILIGTSATLATNWVKYEFDDRLISWYYIDSDSVTKTNSGIIYWMKTVKTHFSGRNDWHEIVIELHEVKMLKSSRWDRTLEHYEYDDNDKLTNKYINYDSDFGEIRPGNASEDEAKAIDAALPYAKQRQVRTTFGTNWFYIISIFSEDRDKSGFYLCLQR